MDASTSEYHSHAALCLDRARGAVIILPRMKRCRLPFLLLIAIPLHVSQAHAETEQIDLKALAKKARPAVMLLVVSDANRLTRRAQQSFSTARCGKLSQCKCNLSSLTTLWMRSARRGQWWC
jgi:hypothetical protein